ncbi:MAG: DUF2946 family protein [Methyloligellaceae bacterium]
MRENPIIFRNRILARLLILGMLFQAFTAVFHISANAAGQNGALSLLSKTIVICTGSGIQTITLNGENSPDDGHEHKSSHTKCPVCFSLSGNSTALKHQTHVRVTPFFTRSRIHIEPKELTDSKPDFRHGRDPPLKA